LTYWKRVLGSQAKVLVFSYYIFVGTLNTDTED